MRIYIIDINIYKYKDIYLHSYICMYMLDMLPKYVFKDVSYTFSELNVINLCVAILPMENLI